ncbi:methyltransferase-like protein 25B [Styela clava]
MDVNIHSISSVKEHLNNLLQIYNQFKFLTDSYIIEFFIEKHWMKLPLRWREILDRMSPSGFAKEVFVSSSCVSTVLPLSLIAFKACCLKLSLSRSYNTEQDTGEFCHSNPSQNKLLKHIFRKHVNPKKQHEIRKLSKIITDVASKAKVSKVADIGSGQGHLSRLLAIGHGFDITSIESDEKNVDKAKQFDVECIKQVLKDNPNHYQTLPNHVLHHIDPFISEDSFFRLFISEPNTSNDPHILLSGLHACGDLSSTMIHSYVESEKITALVSVACCYMKLTQDVKRCSVMSNQIESKSGYPLSKFVQCIKDHNLSYKSREISCHANEVFAQRLQTNCDHLKIHCYRAVLEHILRQKHADMIRIGVQISKKAYLKTFQEYLDLSCAKLSLSPISIANNIEVSSMLSDWGKVVLYYGLCLMLAPIIESIILLDRAVYLFENGLDSSIPCIFNPELSPRCFALISTKSVRYDQG